MSFTSKQATHTTITLPKTENAGMDNRPSARQIFITGILAGEPKAVTKQKIEAAHPTAAACTKFDRHYGWYKSTLKKEGKLPGSQPAQPVAELSIADLERLLAEKKAALEPQPETEAQRVERLAAELAARVDAELAEQA